MKRIGIVTWYHHSNFGTALQVTALSNVIESLGYEVKVVNYKPSGEMVNTVNLGINDYIKKFKDKLKAHINDLYVSEAKEKIFRDYIRDNLHLTELCNTKSELFDLNDSFDAFVCGSDQVWTPLHFDPTFYLDFVDSGKKIAYAPSLGVSNIDDKAICDLISQLLSDFSFISVREKKGKEILSNIIDKECFVALDPTLLLKKDDWFNVLNIEKAERNNEGYLLCYFLGNNESYWKNVKSYSRKNNLDVFIIPVFEKDTKRGYKILDGLGPSEFVKYIANADTIFTDSFHGMIFSIILNKNFYAFKRFKETSKSSQNSRVFNLLNITGLDDRLVDSKYKFDQNLINYESVEVKLGIEREKSINYLKHALNQVTKNNVCDDIKQITNTCCGCGVCACVCPTKAIDIKIHDMGFFASEIDADKCVKCDLCVKVCPFRGDVPEQINESTALYMMKNQDKKVLSMTSSGGVASGIANYYIEKKYKVVGCMYDNETNKANHVIVQNKEDLSMLQGSKYLQSSFKDVLREINKEDNVVLFGTPCQIAGCRKYFEITKHKGDYVLIELICHGVPSYHLWNAYLSEFKEHGKIEYVNFRDKEKSWREKNLTIKGENIAYSCLEKDDYYLKTFCKGHVDMDSCYECKFRNSCVADLKIGDFWGDKYIKDMSGASMVIIGSSKGEKLIHELHNKFIMKKENINDFWINQAVQNEAKPVFRNQMIMDLASGKIKVKDVYHKYEEGIDKEEKVYQSFLRLKKLLRK